MPKRERGQATTETILLTWLLITLIAAMYQIFLANDAMYRSLSAVHQRLFADTFTNRNCYDDTEDCTYTRDRGVLWSTADIPEVRVPRVGLFIDDLGEVRIYSNVAVFDALCPDLPCKRTKVGAGTYQDPIDTLLGLPDIYLDAEGWLDYLESAIGSLLDS